MLDKYEVQAIFGFHLWPGLAKGEVFFSTRTFDGTSSETDIIIKGQSAHIASSEKGIDSLEAAVRFLKNVYDFDAAITDRVESSNEIWSNPRWNDGMF